MICALGVVFSLIVATSSLTCEKYETKCVFNLKIEPRLTMMYGKNRVTTNTSGSGDLYFPNGTRLTEDEASTVLTTDGVNARLVISINGQFPGPEMVMYADQEVEVVVENLLHTDSITVHFHGLHQRGTPWFDGVAYVTQCPILPGTKFTYYFKASPSGTHWYHAHIGDQRGMGLYGALIVKERDPKWNGPDIYNIVLQDWNHDMDTETAYQKMIFGIQNCDEFGCQGRYKTTNSSDGAKFSQFQFHTGLVNGKGRFRTSASQHNNAPLTEYIVTHGRTYRFRVISAATLYPFRLYVAGHSLTLVASDGRNINPIQVDSFIIQTGEQYDFLLDANQSPKFDYMIRAESLEIGYENIHVAEAILKYQLGVTKPIKETEDNCSEQKPCIVFNCPFKFYPKSKGYTCLSYNDVSATEDYREEYKSVSAKKTHYFQILNFAFPGTSGNTPGSVNGRQFLSPKVAALVQPKEVDIICPEICIPGNCECPYTISIKNKYLVELVFSNVGSGRGWSHPVHLHGHSFFVLQYGFPVYDSNTGEYISDNEDIECEDEYCTKASWRGEEREKTEIDQQAKRIPPLKDTVLVPTGGFARVRLRADNPGLWFLHCHIDLHNTNGMAMMVNESFGVYSRYSGPGNFPRCGDYSSSKPIADFTDGGAVWLIYRPSVLLLVCVLGRAAW